MAGSVIGLWVDQSEHLVRYFETALGDAGGGRQVLCRWRWRRSAAPGKLKVDAIAATSSPRPGARQPEPVTRLEEEKVIGYFGGGYLYAKRSRMEPFL